MKLNQTEVLKCLKGYMLMTLMSQAENRQVHCTFNAERMND